MKVMTIIGTRPDTIKLSRVIAELDQHIDHVLVHTGQNFDYELNEIFFQQLEVRRPDYYLDAAGATAAQTIGNVIARADEVMAKEQPDALLILGDTNSSLAVIAAKRRKIPIFHMEAGNRCFDQRVPEEINRKLVDHISDINLVYTEHARRHLLAEGLHPETVIKTGSPMREVLATFASKIAASDVLDRLGLTADQYFVISAHREENVDTPDRLAALLDILDSLAADYGRRIIFSIHPRTRARIETYGLVAGAAIEFLKPLGFFDYNRLQQSAFCVISDSGTLTEEAAILGFPAITIREAHERPEGMDEGVLIMTGLCKKRVLESIRVVRAQRPAAFYAPLDYAPDNVSKKIVRIILSYTDYVNRFVWRKFI